MKRRGKLSSEDVKAQKYLPLSKKIFEYCTKHNFHEIMSDMVFQAYTNKEEHPLLFMADYLVNLNDASTIDDPELLEIQNLKQEVASFERQNKIKQEEINCLKLKIEALKRQSKNGNSSDVSMLHKKVTSDPRGSKKVKPRKPTATITSDSVSKDCETKKIDEVIPNVVTTEAPKWLLKDLSLSENSSDEDKQILNQKLLKDASDVALCPADELKETENLATTSKVSSTTNIIDTIESSVEASAADILLTEPDHPIEESAVNEQSKTQTVDNPDKAQMVIKESSDEESGEESSQSSQSSDVSQQFIIETEVGPREKPTESIKDKDVDNKAASVLAVHDASSDVRQIDIEVEPLQEVYEERQQPKTTNKPELDKVADVPPPLIQSGLIHSVMDSKLVVKSYKSINDLIVDTLSEDDFNDSENDNLMIDIDESKRIAEHDESSSSLQSSGVNVNEPACSEPPTVQFSIETMLEEMQKAPMLESSNQQPSFVPNFNHELDSIQQTSNTQTKIVDDLEVAEERCEAVKEEIEVTKRLEDEAACESVAPDDEGKLSSDEVSFGAVKNDSKDGIALQTNTKTLRVSDDFENDFNPDYEADDSE